MFSRRVNKVILGKSNPNRVDIRKDTFRIPHVSETNICIREKPVICSTLKGKKKKNKEEIVNRYVETVSIFLYCLQIFNLGRHFSEENSSA